MHSPFKRAFLHPRSLGHMSGLACSGCSFNCLILFSHLGETLGKLARPFLKRRERIARRNLELCFPNMDDELREAMIEKNFMSLGMALFETGMAWFWPDSRVRRWFDVEGYQNLVTAQASQRGVMVVGVHFMSLELGGRVMGLCQPMMATYRQA